MTTDELLTALIEERYGHPVRTPNRPVRYGNLIEILREIDATAERAAWARDRKRGAA